MKEKFNSIHDFATSLCDEELFLRIEKVIHFAIDNINQVNLNSKIWKESIGPHITLADKTIIETSLLLLLAKRITYLPCKIESSLNDLGEKLLPLIRNEHNESLLMRIPQTAAIFGIGHIALCSLGLTDCDFDVLIKRSFENGEVYNTERVPYRILDVFWLNNLIFPNATMKFDRVLPNTILMNKPHPIYMTTTDIYALTHSVMYVTDFGTKPLPPSIDIIQLSSLIDSAIAYHLLSDNLDILGELIMTVAMMDIPWSPYVKTAWILFTKIWDKLGFLPCPTFDASAFKLLTGEEASSYAFKHLYHTTYVGGILCCLLLNCRGHDRSDYTKSFSDEVHVEEEKLLAQIKNCIGRADSFSQKHYNYNLVENLKINSNVIHEYSIIDSEKKFIVRKLRQYFDQNGSSKILASFILSDPELKNDELGAILTDAFLIHSIQDYNLPLLTETLSCILNFKIPISFTTYKAIEFIINQQVSSGAIGAHFLYKSNLETLEALEITSELSKCLFNMEKYIKENKSLLRAD